MLHITLNTWCYQMWLAIIGDRDYWSYPSGRSVRLYTDGCVVDSGTGLMGPCRHTSRHSYQNISRKASTYKEMTITSYFTVSKLKKLICNKINQKLLKWTDTHVNNYVNKLTSPETRPHYRFTAGAPGVHHKRRPQDMTEIVQNSLK